MDASSIEILEAIKSQIIANPGRLTEAQQGNNRARYASIAEYLNAYAKLRQIEANIGDDNDCIFSTVGVD